MDVEFNLHTLCSRHRTSCVMCFICLPLFASAPTLTLTHANFRPADVDWLDRLLEPPTPPTPPTPDKPWRVALSSIDEEDDCFCGSARISGSALVARFASNRARPRPTDLVRAEDFTARHPSYHFFAAQNNDSAISGTDCCVVLVFVCWFHFGC